MEESKTLIEQLRDMVELSTESNQYPTVHADAILGHLCVNKSDERELFATIADRIEHEYMPLPMLEGAPLKVGDKVDGYNQVGAEVVAIMNSEMIIVRSTVKGGSGYHDGAYPLLLWDVSELNRHQHDTLERIEEDALMKAGDYCMEYDVDCLIGECEKAMRLDLLRRQREVLERGQE